MSVNAERLKTGYADLSDDDKNDLKRFINDYDTSTYARKIELKSRATDALNKSLGPTFGNRCSQCGK